MRQDIDPVVAAKRVLDDDVYQTTLPGKPEPREVSWWWEALSEPLAILAIAGIVVVLIVFLVLLVDTITARRRHRIDKDDAGDRRSGDQTLADFEIDLAEISRLSADGRYVDAIHQLLLATLAELSRRTERGIAPAATSREVLDEFDLSPKPHAALGDLVRSVELTLFGGRTATRDDYENALERYHAFCATTRRSR